MLRAISIICRFHLSRWVSSLLAAVFLIVLASSGHGQQPPAPTPSPTPQTPPPVAPAPVVVPPAQSAAPANPLTAAEAVQLALTQASAFQQAQLSERLAAEDVRQAQAAFLPKLASPSTFIYTSPLLGVPRDTPPSPSFIANNAVTESEALVGVTGEVDLAGRLRATLRRNRALLEAAHAGTEAARRALIQATAEAYYGLALAAAKRRSSELNVAAAEEFERITSLLASGGEVAQVDLLRARLQTTARRDELEQARANESAAADSLRVFVGYDFSAPVAVADLSMTAPQPGDVERFTAEAIAQRPEFAQFEAQRRAARLDVVLARAERRPQLTYNVVGGFDTDSLKPEPLRQHTGTAATLSLTIPIFDWGASKSREQQARLRAKSFESERDLAVRNFTQQFYGARAQALAAASRYQIFNASVADAEKNVQASIARYRSGEAPIIEVSDALTTLATQRAALYQALFDYKQARARLLQVTGQ